MDAPIYECDASSGLRQCGRPVVCARVVACDPATVVTLIGTAARCGSDSSGSCFEILGIPYEGGVDARIDECDGGHFVRECGGSWAPCSLPCDLSRPPPDGSCSSDGLGSCVVYSDAGPMPRAECDGGFGFVRSCGNGPETCSYACDPASPPEGATCSTDRWGDCARYVMDCDGGAGFVRACGSGPRDCAIDCDPAIIHPSLTCGEDEHGSCFIDAVDAG